MYSLVHRLIVTHRHKKISLFSSHVSVNVHRNKYFTWTRIYFLLTNVYYNLFLERDPYLVFSDRRSIRKLALHKSEFISVVPDLAASIALDYDLINNWMYWTDVDNATIQRAVLSNKNNTSSEKETIISGVRSSEGIAIDWVARKLYWTDSWLKRIEVANLDGSMRLALIHSGLELPRAVVLHPAIGLVYIMLANNAHAR